MRFARLFLVGLMMVPALCSAEAIFIAPTLELSPEHGRQRLEDTERSSILLRGTGDRLSISYTSPVRIDIDFVPIRRGNGYDPAEMAHFSLPPSDSGQAIVDLTVTPGWWPLTQQYKVFFFNPPGRAQITAIDFIPWTWRGLLSGIVTHIAIRETYQVSTFHTLRGSSVLSLPLSGVLGVVTLLAAAGVFWLRRKNPLLPVFTALIIGSLVYTAWFGIDLARFSVSHLRAWTVGRTYSKEGAAQAMTDAIQSEAKKSSAPLLVFVCTDLSDFYAKTLRYFLYPIPVSVRNEDIARATHIVVAEKVIWTYADDILNCGPVGGKARKIAELNDGSVLFASTR
ncbi:hypothetical protein HZA87_06175 [Candidatus Uhrbacteria bacterium]|nr:hypothetical protein [Candidatus Uhrbacteria bacterium]